MSKSLNEQLLVAVQNADTEKLIQLIEEGANVNIRNIYDETPLMLAVQYGFNEVVEVLIENGANVNAQSNFKIGRTALMFAVEHANTDIVLLLLKKGADINVHTKYGDTALSYSLKQNHYEIPAFLITKGADVNFQNERGETALFITAENGRSSLFKLLLEYGAIITDDMLSDTSIKKEVKKLLTKIDSKDSNISDKVANYIKLCANKDAFKTQLSENISENNEYIRNVQLKISPSNLNNNSNNDDSQKTMGEEGSTEL